MASRLVVLFVMSVALIPAAGLAQLSPNSTASWITRGDVYAVARTGSTVFFGGEFDTVAPRHAQIGGFGLLLPSTGQEACPMPEVNGPVNAIEPDGAGGFFIGGAFSKVGGTPHVGIAHVLPTCVIDNLGPHPGRSVSVMSAADDVLYKDYDFDTQFRHSFWSWQVTAIKAVKFLSPPRTEVFVAYTFQSDSRGHPRYYEIRSFRSDLAWQKGFQMETDNVVSFLEVDHLTGPTPRHLWAAGAFTRIGGMARRHLALIDLDLNAVTSFNADPDAPVTTLAVAGSSWSTARIYVGGYFEHIGGGARRYLAALTDKSTALPFNPSPDRPVLDLALDGTTPTSIYVGGSFSTIGGAARLYGARLDVETGTALEWNPSFDGVVRAIALTDPNGPIAVGGSFTALKAQTRHNLAAVNLDTGQLLPFSLDINGRVNALTIDNDVLYVAGDFTSINSQGRNRLASFAPVSRALTAWNPNANESVRTIAVAGSVVFAGGTFTQMGTTSRLRFAAIDATTGIVSTTFARLDLDAPVNKLLLVGNALYVGGAFTSIGGVSRTSLVRLNATTGTVDTTWVPSVGAVLELCAQPGVLYVSTGAPSALDVTTAMPTTWHPSVGGTVRALSCSSQFVYTGSEILQSWWELPQMLTELRTDVSVDAAYATDFTPITPTGAVQATVLAADGLLSGAKGGQSVSFSPDRGGTMTALYNDRVAFYPQPMPGVPAPPIMPTVTTSPAAAGSIVHVEWSPPPRGPRPTMYLIDAGPSPGSAAYLNGLSVVTTSVDLMAPTNVSAFVRIRAATAFGAGRPSEELSFATAPSCVSPPEAPLNPTVVVDGSMVTVSWMRSPIGPVTLYRVEVGFASGRTDFTATVGCATTSFSSLAPSGVYYVRVRAIGNCGISLPSSEMVVVVPGPNALTAPFNVDATVSATRTVTVTWRAPSIGFAIGYRLDVGSQLGAGDFGSITTSGTSHRVTNVPSGTYYVRVYAMGTTAMSAPSDDLMIRVP